MNQKKYTKFCQHLIDEVMCDVNVPLRPRGVSKEPQLAVGICIEDEISEEGYKIDLPVVATNLIPAGDRAEFCFYYLKDNWDALTIKVKPDLWGSKSYCYYKITEYCDKRDIKYYFLWENEDTNLHTHGIYGFPNGKSRKLFQVYINKLIGKMHQSPKMDENNNCNPSGWYDYIHGLVAKKLGFAFE